MVLFSIVWNGWKTLKKKNRLLEVAGYKLDFLHIFAEKKKEIETPVQLKNLVFAKSRGRLHQL